MNDEPTMRNQYGQDIPQRLVRPERVLEDQLVRDLVAKADALHAAIAAFKGLAFEDIDALRAVVAERYNTHLGGRRGGLKLHSYDQALRVEVSVADMMTFGPELQVAKVLLDECLTEWTEGGDARVRTIVMDAFDVGEGGKVRVDRILALRQLNITDPKWVTAMQAINDALRVERSRQYVRLYRRPNAEAAFVQITLDTSRV